MYNMELISVKLFCS